MMGHPRKGGGSSTTFVKRWHVFILLMEEIIPLYKALHIPGGAGFQPSTACFSIFVFFFASFAGTSGGSAPWHLARVGVRGSDRRCSTEIWYI